LEGSGSILQICDFLLKLIDVRLLGFLE